MNHVAVLLKAVQDEDAQYLYDLTIARLSEPETNISHQAPPHWDDHVKFVWSRGGYRHWWTVWADEERIGSLSLTENNEIGIVLAAPYRGRGFAGTAIRAMMQAIDPLPAVPGLRRGSWVANINPANLRSRKLFEKLGFKFEQVTYVKEQNDGKAI